MGRKTTGDSPIARYKIARRLEWREIQLALQQKGYRYTLNYLTQTGSGSRNYSPKLDGNLRATFPDFDQIVGN